MTKQDILNSYLGNVCGSPGHDRYFKVNDKASDSIIEMIRYGRQYGISFLLHREYPDVSSKNIIINVINDKLYLVDGNRHCIALLMLKPDITIGEIDMFCHGTVRIWFSGVEEGKSTVDSPHEVYIPSNIDVSKLETVRSGVDMFKEAHEKIHIIPASLPFDSDLFNWADKGRPLYQTALSVIDKYFE